MVKQMREEENKALKETAKRRLETIKKRIAQSQKARNEKEDVINGLFSLYETVILEDDYNCKPSWKNSILEQIKYLIQY